MDAPPSTQALALLEEIAKAGESYAQNDSGAREKLLSLAHSLAAAMELPSEAIQRIGWAEPARFALMRTAIDLRLFEELEKRGASGTSVAELANASKADPLLISRTMKHLAAMRVVGERDKNCYAPTSFSTALTEPKYRDGITYIHDVAGPSFHQLPAYLKSISYGHPTNITDGPFQYAHKTSSPFFMWLAENPELATCFNNYMSGYRAGKPSWVDPGFYPVQERLIQGMKSGSNEVLLVDVGGGLGHDLELLKQKYPQFPGRLILQDKQDVIDQIPGMKAAFEKTVHDFFTPQPVHGARSYHLHSVLHDWDDTSCVLILKNIVPGMSRGYSKVLINELVVPDRGAGWPVTNMDWLMMALGAVKERAEKDWRRIIEEAGLKVTGIWVKDQGSESLIECELP